MKLFKNIMLTVINILLIPMIIVLSYGILFYMLPSIQSTKLTIKLLEIVNESTIFWVTISVGIFTWLFLVLSMILGRNLSAKFRNLFIHINTWVGCLASIFFIVYTFINTNPLVATEIIISKARKIGMGIIMLCLIVFHLFSTKISKIVNRRIQAYETAKESNIVGRGSVVFNNILKLCEVLFPELLILILICLCVSWNISCYFIYILISVSLPLLGNIKADINTRDEIKWMKAKEENALIQKIAQNVNKKGVK